MLDFVNRVLPALDANPAVHAEPVEADTPLFATSRLDSLSILQLIAAIEELTGEPVPDSMVTMKHFQSIETITRSFCHERVMP